MKMDMEDFRRDAPKMIDYIANYLQSISERSLTPSVSGGYLKSVFQTTAPNTREPFDKIMEDLEKYIMPGLVHWQHPAFYAHFPSNSSYPTIIAELFKDVLGCESFHGVISPSIYELDALVLDWFGKHIGLPNAFLHFAQDSDGGAIMGSSRNSNIFNSMLCARQKFFEQVTVRPSSMSKSVVLSSLIAYCSDEGHSSIRKAAVISMVNLKILDTDENFRFRGDTLLKAIKHDKKIGFIPFFVCVTTGTCVGECDPLEEIGLICKEYGIWLHVDAAYAGTAMICPELRHFLNGIEYASAINVSPAKFMALHLDCTVLFVKDLFRLVNVQAIDMTQFDTGLTEREWYHQKRVSSGTFKLWFVMRSYGVEGLQNNIRHHIRLAKIFENSVRNDGRFKVLTSQFGIVSFRLGESDTVNRSLLHAINTSNMMLLSCHNLKGKCALRFIISDDKATESDVKKAWAIISECADKVLQENAELIATTAHLDNYKYTVP